VQFEGKTGVFMASGPQGPNQASNPPAQNQGGGQEAPAMTAKFQPVQTGIRDGEQVEVMAGIPDGARVVTTGATALRDGDRIVPANTGGGRRGQGPDQARGTSGTETAGGNTR
jgi:hypothetical protein